MTCVKLHTPAWKAGAAPVGTLTPVATRERIEWLSPVGAVRWANFEFLETSASLYLLDLLLYNGPSEEKPMKRAQF